MEFLLNLLICITCSLEQCILIERLDLILFVYFFFTFDDWLRFLAFFSLPFAVDHVVIRVNSQVLCSQLDLIIITP